MANYILVPTIDNLFFSNKWKDAQKFHGFGRYLDKNGKYVNIDHPGRIYQCAIKKERAYTVCERITRIVLGLFVNLLSLGLCNFSKNCRNLIVSDKKVLRFAVEVLKQKPEKLDFFKHGNGTNISDDQEQEIVQ